MNEPWAPLQALGHSEDTVKRIFTQQGDSTAQHWIPSLFKEQISLCSSSTCKMDMKLQRQNIQGNLSIIKSHLIKSFWQSIFLTWLRNPSLAKRAKAHPALLLPSAEKSMCGLNILVHVRTCMWRSENNLDCYFPGIPPPLSLPRQANQWVPGICLLLWPQHCKNQVLFCLH